MSYSNNFTSQGNHTSGIIQARTRLAVAVNWTFAILTNAISVTFFLVMPEEWKESFVTMLIPSALLIAGVAMLINAIRETVRGYKFGKATLHLDTFPGVIGGKFSGRIILSNPSRSASSYQVHLCCLHIVSTSTDDSFTRKLLWKAHKRVENSSYRNSGEIPVEFNIPYSCLETSNEQNIEWNLQVSSEVPGVDFSVTFVVPVYKTKESRKSNSNFSTELPTPDLASERIEVEKLSDDELTIIIPKTIVRRPTRVVGLFIASTITTVMIVLFLTHDAALKYTFILGLIDLMCFLALCHCFANNSSIKVSKEKIGMKFGGILGARKVSLVAKDIERAYVIETGSVNKTSFYAVVLGFKRNSIRKSKKIISSIVDKSAGEWIAEEINKALRR